ncbi:MAG: ImmA/IrrE family metallo-endopeptidase [bacterium]|nr:ImmA/IrrE family metallo-endopeptidase [bacterium]
MNKWFLFYFLLLATTVRCDTKFTWCDVQKKDVLALFNQTWEAGLQKGLIRQEQRKPKIYFSDTDEKCLGRSIGWLPKGNGSAMVFCEPIIRLGQNEKQFVIGHDIGHFVLGHKMTKGRKIREVMECEANVFAGRTSGPETTIRVMDQWWPTQSKGFKAYKMNSKEHQKEISIYQISFEKATFVLRGAVAGCQQQ